MKAKDALVFDHFFIDATEEDFLDLQKLLDAYKPVRHSKVVVENDAWEGLYIYSEDGAYFEILRNQKESPFGMCQSLPDNSELDCGEFLTEITEPLKTVKRVMPDGKPWFDAYLIDIGKKICAADVWVMNYYRRRLGATTLDNAFNARLESLKLSAGENSLDEILKITNWMSGERSVQEPFLRFALPDRLGKTFNIEIELRPGSFPISFQSLQMDLGTSITNELFTRQSEGRFTLEKLGLKLLLSAKRA